MKKTVIIGAAAGLAVMSGVQAADLPAKARAVEYVKVCSLYGAGFYYVPGTDTCIKLGGYLRGEVAINTTSVYSGNTSGAAGANNRYSNAYTWRSREDLNIDTRTATEYGMVRTYFDAVFTWTSDTYAGQGNGSSLYSAIGSASAPNNAGTGAVSGGTLGLYFAFIQFAGFTMGRAISQFSAPWTNYPGNNYDGLVGGGGTVTGVNQFSYTADFGQGITFTVSAQDQSAYYQAGVRNTLAGGAFGTSDYAGTISPDFVGMVRVDQAWGLLQASAALHDNHAAYYGGSELTGHPDDKWGWAGQLALSIKNIPTGVGDSINIQGVYTNGATRYNIQDLASSAGSNTIYGGTNISGLYQSVGTSVAPDSIFGAIGGVNTEQQLVSTWGLRGAFNHNWSPEWVSSIYGAYAAVSYNGSAKTLICGIGGAGGSFRTTYATAAGTGVTSCNPDYNIGQIGTRTGWTPIKGLTFSGDLVYTMLDQKMAGVVSTPSTPIGKPGTALYQLKDQNTVQLLLRAQRNW